MKTLIKKWVAQIVHETGPVCFACGRWGPEPCPGHGYGGTITQWRVRWLFHKMPDRMSNWVYGWVDPRWTRPVVNRKAKPRWPKYR